VAVRNPLVAPVQRRSLSLSDKPVTFEAILGHRFARPGLLREALTHRSAANSRTRARPSSGASNERLEFIGDRVLGLLMAEWLIERFPGEQEGGLGRRLGHLVSQPVLALVAEQIGLGQALDVAPSEARAGVKTSSAVLADALEAALGAMFVDAGLEPARAFVRRAFEAAMLTQADPPKDPKTALQEWAQQRGQALPSYAVASRTGPSHSPVFVINVSVAGRIGTGTAGAKRLAETLAARDLLEQLKS
jgi:ribonuclease-3